MDAPRTVTLHFQLPGDLGTRFKEACARHKVSQSDFVRGAIREKLAQLANRPPLFAKEPIPGPVDVRRRAGSR